MPVFNPTEPHNGIPVDADFLRDQFNSLKGLIDDQVAAIAALNLRIAALEPPTATGFGDARANGALTQDGMWNGYPAYVTPSGARYYVADMNHYRCSVVGDTTGCDYVNPATDVVTGDYTVSLGISPAGTVA